VVALAVTREGIPVRSWVLPGNTTDVNTVEQVRADLRGWNLGRAMFVADSGMNSQDNRTELSRPAANICWPAGWPMSPRSNATSCPKEAGIRSSKTTCRPRRSSSVTASA
jgi:transposase